MSGMAAMPMATPSGVHGLAWFWLGLLGGAWSLYLALRCSTRARNRWPWPRSLFWSAGIITAGIAVIGPMASGERADFRLHMAAHLLLGMLAPIGLVLAAPVTLTLRTLPAPAARWIARRLSSRLVRGLAHPATAALLNLGGLWALYSTRLMAEMHRHAWLFILIHGHLLLAGCLFTAAIIGIDPIRHRPSWRTRAVVLVAAMGAHAALAKHLYAAPPTGVSAAQARAASQLMYYGGDLIDAVLITVFCWQWRRAAQARGRALNAGRRQRVPLFDGSAKPLPAGVQPLERTAPANAMGQRRALR